MVVGLGNGGAGWGGGWWVGGGVVFSCKTKVGQSLGPQEVCGLVVVPRKVPRAARWGN